MAIEEHEDVSGLRAQAAGLVVPEPPGHEVSPPRSTMNSTKPVEISIVVPLFNEAENVLPLARRILESFAKQPGSLELLLVDDGSTDATWQQMLAARKLDGRVRPLRHLRRAGQSAALWTGFLAVRGGVVGTLDGDLQNDPADLVKMLPLLETCDLVCGVRVDRKDGRLRRISTWVARRARRFVLGVDFRDTGCNLRVFKRGVVPKLFPFDGLHRFMPILAHTAGAVVREVPVSHQPRHAGKSKYGVWNRLGRGILDLAAIAWYRRRQITNVQSVEYRENSDSGAMR